MVQRAFIVPPEAHIGPISAGERSAIIKASVLAGHYEANEDRESAYEKLKGRVEQKQADSAPENAKQKNTESGGGIGDMLGGVFGSSSGSKGRPRQGVAETLMKSAVRTIGSEVGRQIIRGLLGSIMGGRR